MKGSPNWSELDTSASNVQRSVPSPPASPNSDARSSTSSGISNSDSDSSFLISSMGSSSCCRAPSAYEKVLSLGCSPCGRSSSDESLAVLLQVPGANSDGPAFATSLYAPLKLEQRQRDAFRDYQVRSRSVRHELELNLPTHVRLRPTEDPVPSSAERRKQSHHDNCVRPPPNRSPFSTGSSTTSVSSCHSKSNRSSLTQSSATKSSNSSHLLANRCGKKAI